MGKGGRPRKYDIAALTSAANGQTPKQHHPADNNALADDTPIELDDDKGIVAAAGSAGNADNAEEAGERRQRLASIVPPIEVSDVLNKLTPEQRSKIIEMWNSSGDTPPDIPAIAAAVFSGLTSEDLNPNSIFCRSIRRFIVERRAILDQLRKLEKDQPITLTDEQRAYISTNYAIKTAAEIAEHIFQLENPPPDLMDKCEAVVLACIREERAAAKPDSYWGNNKYEPPSTLKQAALRVNKYIYNAIDLKDITRDAKLKQNLTALIRFCKMYRFRMMVDNFEKLEHKELFEQSYIRYVWDKPDLSEIELDMVCNVCNDIVSHTEMQRELERLKSMLNSCADDADGRRATVAIMDAIRSLRSSMDENYKRQIAAWKNIEGTREQRMAGQLKANASILNLVAAWRSQEHREKLLKIAKLRQKALEHEIQRLDELEEIKARILGIGSEDIFN